MKNLKIKVVDISCLVAFVSFGGQVLASHTGYVD